MFVIHCFSQLLRCTYCHNPNDNTTQPQHNLNTEVGLDMKMAMQTTPPNTETQSRTPGASD